MRKVLLAIVSFACMVGCSPESPNVPTSLVESSQDAPDVETVSFAGEEWFYDSVADANSDFYRRSMEHFAYTQPGSDRRLLVVRLPPGGSSEGVYESAMRVQRFVDGKRWVGDGPYEYRMQDGKTASGTYRDGVLVGLDRAYWPDGTIQMETPYVNGKRNGVGNGYYEDGTLQWTATYVNGDEVSGESFPRE